MLIDTLAIIGVGLIGGSIGLAVRTRGVARRVLGIGRNLRDAAEALAHGAIDEPAEMSAVTDADLIVSCAPVDAIASTIREALCHAKPSAVFTDAGSTKGLIVASLANLPRFVGGHPMAGSEKCGPAAARANLFDQRLVVLTPTVATDPDAVQLVRRFWQSLGASVCEIDAAAHDRIVAFTSHLPHVLASGLAGSLADAERPFTAAGFLGLTRVAASDARLWSAILEQNRPAVLTAIDRFAESLDELRSALAAGDRERIEEFLHRAKRVRDALGS